MAKKKKSKRIPVDELTRLAFIYAQQDREAMLSCVSESSDEYKKVEELVEQLRNYRLKRWGRTKFECDFDNARSVSVVELLAREPTIK